MASLLFFLVQIVVGVSSVFGDGHWNIELSPNSISSVPFGGSHVSVWEHAKKPGRYYAMPLVYLKKDSALHVQSILTGVNEMKFDIVLWTVEAKEAVYRYLKTNIKSTIAKEDVELLPMEKIRIVWRDTIRPISSNFKLVDGWKSNTHLPNQVTFQFTCKTEAFCKQLVTVMKNNPDQFDALELEYVINGQKTARRVLTVTGKHIIKGKLFTKLQNMNTNTVYLNIDDVKSVVSESVTSVLSSVTTDADYDYVDTGDEVSLKDVLQNEFTRNKVATDNFQPQMWDSVFWDPIWTRPDKLTKYLNEVLTIDSSDSKNFLLNEQASSSSGSSGGGFSFGKIFSIGGQGSSGSSSASKVQKEAFLKELKERYEHIEWDGEIFQLKPMKLYRLNLSQLSSSTNIVSANIQVRTYESVQSVKVRHQLPSGPQTVTLTPQLVEARLNDKLQKLTTKMDKKHQQMTADTAAVDTNWKNRLIPVENKLKGLHITGLENKKFCILANGHCPAGFVRKSGNLIALKVHSPSNSYVHPVNFGDSKIKWHYQSHANAELHIAACCR